MADGSESAGDAWQGWKPFAIGFGLLVLAAFAWEIFHLFRALALEEGVQRGALWAMLLMIGVTVGTIALVGGGLVLAIRREGLSGPDPGERGREPGRE